jgi:hypothetical protein
MTSEFAHLGESKLSAINNRRETKLFAVVNSRESILPSIVQYIELQLSTSLIPGFELFVDILSCHLKKGVDTSHIV